MAREEIKIDEELRRYQSFQANYEILPIASRRHEDGTIEIHVHVLSRSKLRMQWVSGCYACDNDAQAYALFTAEIGPGLMSTASLIAEQPSFYYLDIVESLIERDLLLPDEHMFFSTQARIVIRSCELSEETPSSMPNSHGRGYIWGFSVEPRSETVLEQCKIDPEPFHVPIVFMNYLVSCLAYDVYPTDEHMILEMFNSELFFHTMRAAVDRFKAKTASFQNITLRPIDTESSNPKRTRC